MIHVILSAFLAIASAESISLTQFGGLNNQTDPVTIGQGQAQSLLNVELNKSGNGIRKRDGYVTYLTGYSTVAVSSAFAWKTQAGNEIILFSNGSDVWRSVNAGTPAVLATVTYQARIYCQNADGTAYCFTSSNDLPWRYDGTTRADMYTVPGGKFNVFTQSRQLIAGATEYPNRLYVSKAGDYINYVGGNDSISSWYEDIGSNGDKITFISYLNGRVIVGKEYSIVGFNMTNQFDSVMYSITGDVGSSGPESIIQRDGVLYFKGSDQHFYAIDGSPGGIKKISLSISSTTAGLTSGKTRQIVQTEKADWDGGDLSASGPGAPFRTDIIIGSVMGSTWTGTDSSHYAWSSGTLLNVSTHDVSNAVSLSSFTVRDYFEDGQYTSNPAWTVTTGAFGVTANEGIYSNYYSDPYYGAINTTEAAMSSGSWKFHFSYTVNASIDSTYGCQGTVASYCFDYRFMKDAAGDFYSIRVINNSGATKTVKIIKSISASETVLTNTTASIPRATNATFEIDRSTDGRTYLYVNGIWISSTTDTTITTPTRTEILASSQLYGAGLGTLNNQFGYMEWLQYKSSGSVISRIFDTGLSTPVGGPFSSTFTASAPDYSILFKVRSSSSPNNDFWTAWSVTSDTLRVPTTFQYWQYYAYLYTNISTKTPVLTSVSLAAATTGQYITSCIQPGPGISAWGTIGTSASMDSGSGISYAMQTGADCGSLGAFATISTGSAPGVSVAQALKVKATFSAPSASSTARLDSLTVNWSEGAVSSPTYGAYWNDALYWTVQNSSGGNNEVLKYDLLHNEWFTFDIHANPMLSFNNVFYFGGSGIPGKLYRFSDAQETQAPTSDDGAPINSYWRSKNLTGGDPFSEAQWNAVSAVMRKQDGGSASITWRANGGDTGSGTYSVGLSTGTNAVRSNYRLPMGTRGTFFSLEVGNNSTVPWELLGARIDLEPKPWRPLP